MIRVPTHRPPTHPGEMLRKEFLSPMQIDEQQLAQSLHVPLERIKEIISERKSINPKGLKRFSFKRSAGTIP